MSRWSEDQAVARAILGNRALRRKWLGRGLFVAVGMMGIGLWVIDGWLMQRVWCFVLWWGACAGVTLFVILFAFYDALVVIRAERESSR